MRNSSIILMVSFIIVPMFRFRFFSIKYRISSRVKTIILTLNQEIYLGFTLNKVEVKCMKE